MDHPQVINIYKPNGLTPLQAIERFRVLYPEYATAKLGYIGRLDPLAEGVLLVLVDEENQNIDEYKGLDKHYEADVILGITTDTYDVMGKLSSLSTAMHDVDIDEVRRVLGTFSGKILQPYPPYSSVRVEGKPLFIWAREGRLEEVEIPKRAKEIYDIELEAVSSFSAQTLFPEVERRVARVEGDFRQQEILSIWDAKLREHEELVFPVLRLRAHCSSGTYIRGLVHELGLQLGVGATTLSIFRSQAGEFDYRDSLHID